MRAGRKIRIIWIFALCSILTAGQAGAAADVFGEQAITGEKIKNTESGKKKKVSVKERNRFFSDSAFVGNSVSLGLKYYFNSKGKHFLGGPLMLVQGSYSFANDAKPGSAFQITYRGKKQRAKDALAAAKVKKVFINMGTNDLWCPAAQAYQYYVKYIQGIKKESPHIVIFIQGTIPMCTSSNKRYLNNTAINQLNSSIRSYCEKHRDLYYIDVSGGLKDAGGGLLHRYSSDGYVHLTMSGYKIWTDNLIAYADQFILMEKRAEEAVKKAIKKKTQRSCDEAANIVESMKAGKKKTELKKKLSKISAKKR